MQCIENHFFFGAAWEILHLSGLEMKSGKHSMFTESFWVSVVFGLLVCFFLTWGQCVYLLLNHSLDLFDCEKFLHIDSHEKFINYVILMHIVKIIVVPKKKKIKCSCRIVECRNRNKPHVYTTTEHVVKTLMGLMTVRKKYLRI